MHSFLDAKKMAKTLRQKLAGRDITLSHGDCLEIVAEQFGLADWNTLSARIAAATDERTLRLPGNWSATGKDEDFYRLGLDPAEVGTVLIESRFERDSGAALPSDAFATLMQSVWAGGFTGQRMRLAAKLRSEQAGAAAIWLRIDGPRGHTLRFDNMLKRRTDGALRGTQDWTERHIVLDVPEGATSIHYGLLLKGYGRAFARAFRLETVGSEIVPTAGDDRYLATPANLDFSQSAATGI